jgi:hypothetical protein
MMTKIAQQPQDTTQSAKYVAKSIKQFRIAACIGLAGISFYILLLLLNPLLNGYGESDQHLAALSIIFMAFAPGILLIFLIMAHVNALLAQPGISKIDYGLIKKWRFGTVPFLCMSIYYIYYFWSFSAFKFNF